MRARLSLVLIAGALAACMSAEEKCTQARKDAAGAWGAYAQAMAVVRDEKQARIETIATAMRGDINKRLSQRAAAEASRLHDEGTAEWHRAYSARQQAGCTSDPECSKLRLESANAEREIASLEQRIKAARNAETSAAGTREVAQAAASAVEDDFEFPAIKLARERSQAAHEACEGVDQID